jgi:hypothetical protein
MMNVSAMRLLRSMAPSLLAAFLVSLLINLLYMGVGTADIQPLLRICMGVGIIFAVLAILVRCPPLFSNEVNALLNKIANELPSSFRPLINRPSINP